MIKTLLLNESSEVIKQQVRFLAFINQEVFLYPDSKKSNFYYLILDHKHVLRLVHHSTLILIIWV